MSSIPPPSSSSSTSSPSWFSGLRSRLFVMSDWLSQLGLVAPSSASSPSARRHSDNDAKMRSSGGVRPADERRAVSLGPVVHDDSDDDNTPVAELQPSDTPSFWLNVDPGSRSREDTIEMQHFGPLDNLLTVGSLTPAQGHTFQPLSMVNPTWCDKCGDFIWGFLKQAVKCENCNYTCHFKCRLLVTLDCHSTADSIKSNNAPNDGASCATAKTEAGDFIPPAIAMDVEAKPEYDTKMADVDTTSIHQVYLNQDPFQWPEDVYQGEKLRNLVNHYNETADGLCITVLEDGKNFSGYLQIHMNFTRPINVVAGERPPSVYDVINSGTSTADQQHRTITSFFLPRNTVKTLHIGSTTTTRQLIVTLLRKFKVADNPHKFALYERVYEHDDGTQTFLRKMIRIADDVCPLRLALSWGSAKCGRHFVLQENDTGDILWDAFEVPELENFLRILEMEEQQYAWQIKQRFQMYRHYLELELKERGEIVSMCTASSADNTLNAGIDFDNISDVFPTAPPLFPADDNSVIFRRASSDPTQKQHLTLKANRSSNSSTDSAASWRFSTS